MATYVKKINSTWCPWPSFNPTPCNPVSGVSRLRRRGPVAMVIDAMTSMKDALDEAIPRAVKNKKKPT